MYNNTHNKDTQKHTAQKSYAHNAQMMITTTIYTQCKNQTVALNIIMLQPTYFTSAAMTGTDSGGPFVNLFKSIWNPSRLPNLFTRSTNQP